MSASATLGECGHAVASHSLVRLEQPQRHLSVLLDDQLFHAAIVRHHGPVADPRDFDAALQLCDLLVERERSFVELRGDLASNEERGARVPRIPH